jgi:hypothetical protein
MTGDFFEGLGQGRVIVASSTYWLHSTNIIASGQKILK